MATTVKVQGLSELIHALNELPKATARRVQQRVLMNRAEPIVDAAKANAPAHTGMLRASIHVTSKRPAGHKTASARAFAAAGGGKAGRAAAKGVGAATVEVFIGPGRLAQSGQTEWGNRNHSPHPYLRPAFDAGKDRLLSGIAEDMWAEIAKAAARLAKKRAR